MFTASLEGVADSITEEIDVSKFISQEQLKSLDEEAREQIIEQLFQEWLKEKVSKDSHWNLLYNFE